MLARRFLYIVAALILVAVGARIWWEASPDWIMRTALVPRVAFTPMPGDPDYAQAKNWLSRPDLPDDPSRYVPPGYRRNPSPAAAVFYIPPTTSLDRTRWNAPIGDAEAAGRLRLFAASQASAFNSVGAVWAPRYRQATIGAFLTDQPDAGRALALAYRDVARAFDAFVQALPPDRPFFLVGHSQGSLHLLRLMHDRIAGSPLSRRVIAAYAVGWPVSLTADLPRLGLPACRRPDQANCLLSWMSFAEPADPHQLTDRYDAGRGFTGQPRRGTPFLCTNPLTGVQDGPAAPAAANRGALVPQAGLTGADLKPGLTGARCDQSGLLLIGRDPGGFDPYVLPGNNFHVFDYALFWANVRADAERRLGAYGQAR